MSTGVLARVRTWGDEDILVSQHQPHLPLSGVLIWGTHSLSQAQINTSGSQAPTNPHLPGPRIELSAPVKSSFRERSRLKVSGIKALLLLPLCPLSGQDRPGHVAACSQCANLMSCLGNPQVPTKKSRRKNKRKSPQTSERTG